MIQTYRIFPTDFYVEEKWHDFIALRHPTIRNDLVLYYCRLAKKYVQSEAKALQTGIVAQEDLESWAMVGLIEAVINFDPEKVVSSRLHDGFTAYLKMCVRRAVVSAYRDGTGGTRGQMFACKFISYFKEEYYKKHGQRASWLEIETAALENHNQRQAKIKKEYLGKPTIQFLDRASACCKPPGDISDVMASNDGIDHELSQREMLERIFDQNEFGLKEIQLTILRLTYFDGLTNDEISSLVGIPAGTVGYHRCEATRKIRFGWARRWRLCQT